MKAKRSALATTATRRVIATTTPRSHLRSPTTLLACCALLACTKLNMDTPPVDASSGRDVCVAGSLTDPTHCGTCGNVCPDGRGCQSGRCTTDVCAPGRADCDGDATNGCETLSSVDTRNCGACGRTCAPARATGVCASSACGVDRCEAGFGDCDGDATNGCERPLGADLAHCGSCGAACVTANGAPSCDAGACTVSACDTNFADCDGIAANGCEVNLSATVAHCDACGNTCPAPINGRATCATRACGFVCDAGFEGTAGACLPRGAPRLVAPLSARAVTTRRPTLRWVLGAGTDGAQVELCRDRAMTADCQTPAATGDTLRPTSPLASGARFWRARGRSGGATMSATSPIWSFVVGPRDAPIDGSRAMPLDLDGDGFAELAVGAASADARPLEDAGAVSVYRGGATGVLATPARVLRGADINDRFGSTIACAGDVNGDGYADMLVGAPVTFNGSSALRPGTVSVFPGGAEGIGAAARPLLRGTIFTFAVSIADAGDVNGDGFSDVAVGTSHEGSFDQPRRSAVRVFWGGEAGVSTRAANTLVGAATSDGAYVVSGAVDLNRDGFADVVIGAPGADPGGRTDAGSVSVYLGSATGVAMTAARVIEGDAPGERFGQSVASLGDVNGDGFDDLGIGAPGAHGDAGSVRVYLGRERGLDLLLARSYDGTTPGERMGVTLASLGDVNGDGHDDLGIGAPGAARGGRENTGRVSIFLGGATGPRATPDRVYEGSTSNIGFGDSIAGLGDVNGDGYADMAIGERGAAVAMTELVGRVSVYTGSTSGLGATPAQVLEGSARGDLFGTAIARVQRARDVRRRPS